MKVRIKILIIVFILVCFSEAYAYLKTTGEFMIPTSNGEKPYKCVIIITQREITFICDKRIFQFFNEFDIPKQLWLKISVAEITGIKVIIKDRAIFISTTDSFLAHYRNFFHKVFMGNILYPEEKWVLFASINETIDVKAAGEELSKIIGKQCCIY